MFHAGGGRNTPVPPAPEVPAHFPTPLTVPEGLARDTDVPEVCLSLEGWKGGGPLFAVVVRGPVNRFSVWWCAHELMG